MVDVKSITVKSLGGNKIEITTANGQKAEKEINPDDPILLQDGNYKLLSSDLSCFVVTKPGLDGTIFNQQSFAIDSSGFIVKADSAPGFYPEYFTMHNYDSQLSGDYVHTFDSNTDDKSDDLKLFIAGDKSKYELENTEYKMEFSLNKYIFSAGKEANSLLNNQYFETGITPQKYLPALNKEITITKKAETNGQQPSGLLAEYFS